MATTLTLQNAINWAKPFLKNQPLDFANQEPALTTGNMILQTMLGAPFRWRHNRLSFSFPLVPATPASGNTPATPAQSDYAVSIPTFGYLENQVCSLNGTNFSLQKTFNLDRPTTLAARPRAISAQLEDEDTGIITFRVDTMPDQAYIVMGECQQKAPILLSVASLLEGVPDNFAFVFNWGFLTVIGMLVDDPRFPIWEKYFIGRLLGLQEGLEDNDINLFLGLWQMNTRTSLLTQGRVQQGQSGRGQ